LLFRYNVICLEAEDFFPVTDEQQFNQKEKQQINYLVLYDFVDGV
jgi:hypothetical protein